MPSTAAESVVHVAAGVIVGCRGVFITRRLPNAHQGGKWEFPGGKILPGESVLAALRRELREELGIEVQEARPFMQVRHAYPDKTVLLDVWRVISYLGTPHGREGQESRWASRDELLTLKFPEADLPVQRRLWLPPLYGISDATRVGRDEFLRRLDHALVGGLRLLQLREPGMNEQEFVQLARDVVALCHRYHARCLLNADPALMSIVGADGVHLNARRLAQASARGESDEYFLAASCHDEHELAQAARIGADLVVLGPVAPTASHPQAVVLGWQRFEELCRGSPSAVFALGGMRETDVAIAHRCGAQGLAMISGLWDNDPAAVVAACERVDD